MLIEVCAYSVDDCLAAQQAGANRIELCSARAEGGLTPSLGLMRQVRAAISLPIFVMIRPRGGDFVYSASEIAVMEADIEVARLAGADGVVLGTLLPDGRVDRDTTRHLIQCASPLPVTFHRAFDLTSDAQKALDELIDLGIANVLTSGQQPRAIEALPLLEALANQAAGRITIMAGSGVNGRNAVQLARTGVTALHLSGSVTTESPMQFRRENVPMASSIPGEYERFQSSEAAIRAVVESV
ncbi:copper homeostasis protein CutC [Fibrella forsythiae]|uniref:PF03932 family protein CutC n=1 Tax=Fibrella forsythiae TaxID=2817061 RepID=A0ABS3JGY4_9BACT|nr:copper homeostasis protein CutC [Fibrella forsythiae]MBO0948524.1 copper homeostasis protein CutC [Fibrella forsythiae]